VVATLGGLADSSLDIIEKAFRAPGSSNSAISSDTGKKKFQQSSLNSLLLREREKSSKKAATKPPYPTMHEIRGFTYAHIQKPFFRLQGGLVPKKISGVGTSFGLLLPGPNSRRALEPSMLLS
jgi:hypothetical protein